jgi:DNA-directed RNA polymerase specialized sigma subunit
MLRLRTIIRAIRKGVSQTDIAKVLGISKQRVSQILKEAKIKSYMISGRDKE